MKRRLAAWCSAPALVIAAVGGWNYVSMQRPLSSTIGTDSRNDGVFALAHYQWYVNPEVLVFDLRGISGTNSEADVLRIFLQFAEAMQSRNFSSIVLAYRGNSRFKLKGAYFKQLGVEFAYQNPIYILRRLPQHVYKMDGAPAFATWTGGWLGVVGHQMQDLEAFGRSGSSQMRHIATNSSLLTESVASGLCGHCTRRHWWR